ncbi:MAG: peptide-methionine (S)-S-oxide reductase MsrA [Anaerolineales bacterium]|jgi:peptide-methionine (S)-S-oxide reductase
MKDTSSTNEIMTIGGGCFWCLEPLFADIVGVEKVEVGYSGGETQFPSYKDVCTGTTGHAEVVQITYNPEVISFKDLLRIFFTYHDPTTLNRQGADVGTQYRSIILYHNERQKIEAEQVIAEIEKAGLWENPIVTEAVPFKEFFIAEDYHQGYFEKNPNQMYCQVVISPKVNKFRKQHSKKLKRIS